jgi:flagellin
MAMNDISLTTGMRSNLLSLQGTVDLLNRTQNRLSSGKKVNTAIDNPVSFFASQALTARASGIDALKDGMGQAIQTIQAADKGIKAITAMIEQAKGLAQSGLSAAAGTGKDTVTVTLNSVADGDTIAIGGTTLVASVATTTATVASVDILFGANIAQGETISVGGQTYVASVGGVAGGYTFIIGADAEASSNNLFARINAQVGGAYVATGATANTVRIVAGSSGLTSTTVAAGTYAGATITPNAGTPITNALSQLEFARTGNDIVDAINLADKFLASTDAGIVALRAGGWTVTADTGVITVAHADTDLDLTATNPSNAATMVEALVSADEELSTLVDRYNVMRTQIDELADDSGYKGKNLLAGNTLTVQFEGTTLDVVGFDAKVATDLNISAAAWLTGGSTAIDADILELDAALSTMRQESSKLAGNLSIITVRNDFSTNIINTLIEGSDKLTLADSNEEGANMLMLQTRQTLATTALSLSAQAAQSVLRLFQ